MQKHRAPPLWSLNPVVFAISQIFDNLPGSADFCLISNDLLLFQFSLMLGQIQRNCYVNCSVIAENTREEIRKQTNDAVQPNIF